MWKKNYCTNLTSISCVLLEINDWQLTLGQAQPSICIEELITYFSRNCFHITCLNQKETLINLDFCDMFPSFVENIFTYKSVQIHSSSWKSWEIYHVFPYVLALGQVQQYVFFLQNPVTQGNCIGLYDNNCVIQLLKEIYGLTCYQIHLLRCLLIHISLLQPSICIWTNVC